jgi:hypothetical protein
MNTTPLRQHVIVAFSEIKTMAYITQAQKTHPWAQAGMRAQSNCDVAHYPPKQT